MTPLPIGNFNPLGTSIESVIPLVAVAVSVNSTEKVGPRSVDEIVNSVGDGCVFT